MSTAANPNAPFEVRAAGEEKSVWGWFQGFLEEELSPYPGRSSVVLRMAISATITMLLIMTFRLPGAGIAAYYTLLLSRDSPQTAVRSALVVLFAYIGCTTLCLLGILLFIDEPLTHFLLVLVSFFVSFFVIKVSTNYTGAAAFAFTTGIVIPLWDAPAPSDVLVTDTLWASASVSVGLGITVAVEYVFHLFEQRDPLVDGVLDRLATVSEVLSQCCGQPIRITTRRRIEQYGTVGASRLRRLASAGFSPQSSVVLRSTVVSLTGRLVDLANAVLHLPEPNAEDSERLRRLARRIDAVGKLLGRGRHLEQFVSAGRVVDSAYPLLPELERTVQLLAMSLTEAGTADLHLYADPPQETPLLVRDAFTNPDHLLFSLRGCLAASLCYVIVNAIAWPGLSTSIVTCMVTALSTIGSSRQKQMLRLAGALAGGVVFGIGSQAFILPMLDSIAGFTVLFLVVTVLAAWIATGSPRISYFGSQIALAFYLIHLQEFEPQTNLAVGRDRVMGVMLGLLAMWLVFDQLGTRPAADEIRRTFGLNLRLLAQLAEPWPEGREPLDEPRLSRLREQIHNNFANVNAQADAILLELGWERRAHLELRDKVRRWQPILRSLFVIETALLQYRLELRPESVAPQIADAQRALDAEVRLTLDRLAERFERGAPVGSAEELQHRFSAVEQAVQNTYADPPARARAVLSLSSHLVEVLGYLLGELKPA